MSLSLEHYRLPKLNNLELLYFPKVKEAYPKHLHHDYAICFMVSGQMQTLYRGNTYASHLHGFTVMTPDEVHVGCMGSDETTYFSFYPSVRLVQDLIGDSFTTLQLPYFKQAIIADLHLQTIFRHFVQAMDPSLERESYSLNKKILECLELAQYGRKLLKHYTT